MTDVRVNRTHVFGDSYSLSSRTDHNGYNVTGWPVFLKNQGTTSDVGNNAVPGARAAGPQGDNTFAKQVAQFASSGPSINGGDLTIVYMGYNDVNSLPSLGNSKAGFTTSADALRNLGAADGGRRLFVTLLHDWSRNPGQTNFPAKGDLVRDWNAFLAAYANSHDNVVAVDMFTVFERILDDPERFGFTNVTTADPAKANSTALFTDATHFGERGQKIIAEVYRHYLTRGWDWANSLAAGAKATERLNQDIDQALLLSQQLRMAETPLRLNAFPVGTPPPGGVLTEDAPRFGFTETPASAVTGGGVGLNYVLSRDSALGIVVGRYGVFGGDAHRLPAAKASVDSDTVALYLDNAWHGANLQTRVAYARDAHVQRGYDGLTQSGRHAEFGGTRWLVQQRVGYPVRTGRTWATPWFDLSHVVQTVDGFTIANPYVSDETYSPASAGETLATVGLSLELDPISVGHNAQLTLGGGLSYTRSLRRDDYTVEIREAALPGYTQREVIPRSEVERAGLQFHGDLRLGEALSVRGGYGWLRDSEVGGRHDVRLGIDYRF